MKDLIKTILFSLAILIFVLVLSFAFFYIIIFIIWNIALINIIAIEPLSETQLFYSTIIVWIILFVLNLNRRRE